MIETNTFGGNRIRLAEFGLEKSIIDVNRKAVDLALHAARNQAIVAGSVGPLGKLLVPYGDIHLTEAIEIYNEQIRILLESGAELILIETMISLDEALIALQAAQEAGAKIVGVTLTFDPSPEGPRTPFGESPTKCVESLESKGASFIGSNCGSDFKTMKSVAAEMKKVASKPILIQANAGLPTMSEGKNHFPEGPDSFAAFVRELSSLGIQYIGGCCGTTPGHIAAASAGLTKRDCNEKNVES